MIPLDFKGERNLDVPGSVRISEIEAQPRPWLTWQTILEGFCPYTHPIDDTIRAHKISPYLDTTLPRPHAQLRPYKTRDTGPSGLNPAGLAVGRCPTCNYGWLAGQNPDGARYILRVDCLEADVTDFPMWSAEQRWP
jgi:hypothetical protein